MDYQGILEYYFTKIIKILKLNIHNNYIKDDLMKTIRLVYADILRIVATFSVIILHTAASKWYSTVSCKLKIPKIAK